MKNWKKTLSLLLSAAMVAGITSVTAFAEDTPIIEDGTVKTTTDTPAKETNTTPENTLPTGNTETQKTDNTTLTSNLTMIKSVGEDNGIMPIANDLLGDPAPMSLGVAEFNSVEYPTLAAAVEAAVEADGGTITLLDSCSGTGIGLYSGNGTNNAADGKFYTGSGITLTIDFNGKTYTCGAPAVGSTGTETQGFHLEVGNNVTLKNGTLKADTNDKDTKMLIQNYCNLKLESMTLDESGNSNMLYVISNNCNSLIVKGATTIKAPSGAVAFDVWYGMNKNGLYDNGVTVTFNNDFTGNVKGIVEYGLAGRATTNENAIENGIEKTKISIESGNFDVTFKNSTSGDKFALDSAGIVISGGTFSQKPLDAFIADGYTAKLIGNSYVVKTAEKVAQVAGGGSYTTLAAAVKAIEETGGTITLLDDCSEVLNSLITGKDITIDLNGKTFTLENNVKVEITNGGKLTLKNGSLVSKNMPDGTKGNFNIGANSSIVLEKMTVDSTGTVLYPQGNAAKVEVTDSTIDCGVYAVATNASSTNNGGVKIYLKNSEFTSKYGCADMDNDSCPIFINVNGTLDMTNCTVNGTRQGVIVRGGEATITNSSISLSGKYTAGKNKYLGDAMWGSGNEVPMAALVVGNHSEETAPYGKTASCTLTNTTVSAASGCKAIYVYAMNKDDRTAALSITGAGSAVNNEITKNGNSTITITGGDYKNKPNDFVPATADKKYYVVDSSKTGYAYTVTDQAPTEAPVVVEEATTITIPENADKEKLPDEAITAIKEATDKVPVAVEGVSDALKSGAKDDLAAAAGVNTSDLTENDIVEVKIDVQVIPTEAKITDDGSAYVAFDITPVATVAVNGATQEKAGAPVTVPVTNDKLDGSKITVRLPLPAGFEVAEIMHTCTNGMKERFLLSETAGKGKFVIETESGINIAVLEISRFSELRANGTVTVAAKLGAAEYGTLQEAIDAASNNATITLESGFDTTETVTVSGKTITINCSTVDYNADNITAGDNCKKDVTGTAGADQVIKITYSKPAGHNSGNGGGGGAVSTYTLTFDSDGGSAIDPVKKGSGITIDLSDYTPTKDGYTFSGWYSDDELTEEITSIKLTKNTTIYAKWTEYEETTTPVENNPFTDVTVTDYFYRAVLWAVENGITGGMTSTTFAPSLICTRAQAVTFLWNADGRPDPATTACPFTDVDTDAYYYKAVLWAVEKGITSGTADVSFSPDSNVTRGQMVTFLWNAEGRPEATGTVAFTDVTESDYFYKAVLWAVGEGITSGMTSASFAPEGFCTRAQAVTFLYNNR